MKNWQDFIDKNGENLKILMEIFCQKLIVSTVISAFLDHLKTKIFLLANHGGCHRAPPALFKISWSAPDINILSIFTSSIKTGFYNSEIYPYQFQYPQILQFLYSSFILYATKK